jgi:hypothetical protein
VLRVGDGVVLATSGLGDGLELLDRLLDLGSLLSRLGGLGGSLSRGDGNNSGCNLDGGQRAGHNIVGNVDDGDNLLVAISTRGDDRSRRNDNRASSGNNGGNWANRVGARSRADVGGLLNDRGHGVVDSLGGRIGAHDGGGSLDDGGDASDGVSSSRNIGCGADANSRGLGDDDGGGRNGICAGRRADGDLDHRVLLRNRRDGHDLNGCRGRNGSRGRLLDVDEVGGNIGRALGKAGLGRVVEGPPQRVVVLPAMVRARRDGARHEGGRPEGIGELHDGEKDKSSKIDQQSKRRRVVGDIVLRGWL